MLQVPPLNPLSLHFERVFILTNLASSKEKMKTFFKKSECTISSPEQYQTSVVYFSKFMKLQDILNVSGDAQELVIKKLLEDGD